MSNKKNRTCFTCYPAYKLGHAKCSKCGLVINTDDHELIKEIVTESITVHKHGDQLPEILPPKRPTDADQTIAGKSKGGDAPKPPVSSLQGVDVPSPAKDDSFSPFKANPVPTAAVNKPKQEATSSSGECKCDDDFGCGNDCKCSDCKCDRDCVCSQDDQIGFDEDAITVDLKLPTRSSGNDEPQELEEFDPEADTRVWEPPDSVPHIKRRLLIGILVVLLAGCVIGLLLYAFVGPLQSVRDTAGAFALTQDARPDDPVAPALVTPTPTPAPTNPEANVEIDISSCQGYQVAVQGSRVVLKNCAERVPDSHP